MTNALRAFGPASALFCFDLAGSTRKQTGKMEVTTIRLNVAEIADFRRKLRDNKVIEDTLCRNSLVQAFEKASIRDFEALLIADLDTVCKKIGIASAVKMRLKALQRTMVDPEATASAVDMIAVVQITNKRKALRPVGFPMETTRLTEY